MKDALSILLRAAFTGWIAVTFIFVLLRISGDPALQILGGDVPPETLDRFRVRLGLDLPLWQQYLRYWDQVLRGDFGQSFRDGRDVAAIVFAAVPQTALLMGTGFLIAVVIGVPAGVIAALNHNKAIDRSVIGLAMIGFATPNFFLAIMLLLIFSMTLRLLPAGGSGTWEHLVMPALTVGTFYAAMLARFVRASMLDVLGNRFWRLPGRGACRAPRCCGSMRCRMRPCRRLPWAV